MDCDPSAHGTVHGFSVGNHSSQSTGLFLFRTVQCSLGSSAEVRRDAENLQNSTAFVRLKVRRSAQRSSNLAESAQKCLSLLTSLKLSKVHKHIRKEQVTNQTQPGGSNQHNLVVTNVGEDCDQALEKKRIRKRISIQRLFILRHQ